MATARQRFLAAISGDQVDRPPIWLMRQAGRYLPGYRAVRSVHGFWDVCHSPELSTQVALEPMRLFGLDAAIVFSDILVVPEALGLGVTFGAGEGPQIARPLRTQADLDAWNTRGIAERLAFLPAAVKHLRAALDEQIKDTPALLGFAGAPFTLFCYTVEGGGSDDFRRARVMLLEEPALAKKALETIADIVSGLLEAQLDAGADLVQLFDTWGGLLDAKDYATYCVPMLRRITDRVHKKGGRVLLFIRGGGHLLPALADAHVDGVSLDWRTPFAAARALGKEWILQGNLDPVRLFAAPQTVAESTRAMLAEARAAGGRLIVNLGHGILPGTPEASVRAMVETVQKGW
jgi:uroporphyrinogen decarboxylase